MFFVTAKSILQLIILIMTGVLVFRIKWFKAESIQTLNSLVLHLALPATILKAFQSDILFSNKGLIVEELWLTIFYLGFTIILSYVFIRKGKDCRVERASVAFTNNAFIAIPLLTAMFGEIGAFYASGTTLVFSFMVWSVLYGMLSGQFALKEVLRRCNNESIYTALLACLLLLTGIRVPEFIMTPVSYLSSLMTPLAMLSIGGVIAGSDIRGIFSRRVLWVSFVRLVITTLIVSLALRLLIPDDQTKLLCFCVLCAAPSGSLVTILSKETGNSTDKASAIFLMTTILSAFTIPLLVLLMDYLA